MNHPTPVETINPPLDQITIPSRLRDADPDEVREMMVSLRERGQLQPIVVLPRVDGKYILNIGLHRLLAATALGWKTIRAEISDRDPLQAELDEIDENLYRAELNPLDEAVFLARRREIFEQLHGIVARGRPKKKIGQNSDQLSFFDDTTARFGLPRRQIKVALTRFNRLEPEVRQLLRKTRTARIGTEVDALCRLVPFEQIEVAKLLASAIPPKNVVAALAKVRGIERRGLHIKKTATDRLMAIWGKASADERKAFIDWLVREGFLHGTRVAKGVR